MFKTYILILKLKRDLSIGIGSLGIQNFKKGYFIYIGSGKRNINLRILRHIKKEKRLHWHIDYLTRDENFIIKKVYLIRDFSECKLAEFFSLNNFYYIKNFGSSDCKCKSHLFYSKNLKDIESLLKSVKKRRFL